MNLATTHEMLDADGPLVRSVLRAAADAVIVVDREQRIVALSDAASEWLEYSIAALRGEPLGAVLRLVEATRLSGCRVTNERPAMDPLERVLAEGWQDEPPEHLCALFGGRALPVRVRFAVIHDDDGAVVGAVCTMSDRSTAVEPSRNRVSEQDSVTGLPTRDGFTRQLADVTFHATPPNRPFWVAHVDIDRFRLINDAAGHAAGDALLRSVARRLRAELRSGDVLARIGSDEFGVLIQPCARRDVEPLLRRIADAIGSLQFSWQGRELPSTISIGVAPLSSTSESAATAQLAAERARFAAKESGRGQVCFAACGHEERQHGAEVASVSDVLAALHEGRLLLQSQDVLSASGDGGPRYRELLLRMRDGNGAMVPPGMFIPGAERYCLMESIDRWVVEAAMTTIAALPSDGVRNALNLSGQSLSSPDFRNWLIERLEAHPELCHRLCVEVTETAAVTHLSAARSFFERLGELDVLIALDDFGTGMSSFGYLNALPAHYLKIDGSFVRDIASNEFNRQVVRAVAKLACAAGMICIAEHVEHDADRPLLAELGVDLVQGWGVARERAFRSASLRPEAGRYVAGVTTLRRAS